MSQARDGMISPELQLRAIEEYCQRRGYEIVHTLEDLDLSGRFWKRRQVERAIDMIERGDADVIVVWRWSRVTRARLDWAVAVDRVEAAGGRLESATESFDTTTSVGRLARGILAEIAAFESDRLGDGWREVRDRRIRLGLTSHGHQQFGYRKQQNGSYVRDRRTGPVLAEMYERYNDGASFRSLVRWLNEQGVRTAAPRKAGSGWSLATIQRTMDSGFAAGYVRDLDRFVCGAHKPVISDDVWQAYRRRREATSWRRPTEFDDFLLTGLVWCGCGSRMSPMRESGPWSRYRCNGHPKGRSGLTILRRRGDGLVQSWLIALVADPLTRKLVDADIERHCDRQAARARALRDQLPTTPPADRPAVVAALDEVRQTAAVPAPAAQAQALLEDWDVLAGPERRARMAALLRRVDVHNDLPNPLIVVHTTWGSVMEHDGASTAALGAPESPRLDADAEGDASDADLIDPLQLLTPGEAARVAGVEPQTLREWYLEGRLPHTQPAPDGRSRRYAIHDLRKVHPRRRPGPPCADPAGGTS